MSKVKSGSKATKPAKSDALSKVKDAAVAKPAQSSKSKSKDVANAVVQKEEKKSKKSKKAKEPTPEPESESEESESEESESSEDDAAPPAVATNGKKTADSSDDSDSSEDDAPAANGVLGKAPAVTEVDSDDSDSSDEESEEEAKPAKVEKKSKATKPAREESSDDSSDSDAEMNEVEKKVSSEDDSDDSSDSSEEEAEKKPVNTKRKAEAEAEPAAKKPKTAAVTEGQSGNLFVGSLSWNIDDAWLRETFEEHGEISRVQVMTDRATGRSKGFGYVEFTNAEDAAAAHAAKQGFELDGRTINVDFANSRPAKSDQTDRRKSYGDQVSEPSDTLFLGNLSFDVGQETVTESFSPHGTILGIRLPTDRETGEPKGFGYVTFASIDEAKTALEAMQGSYIGGRPVRLDYSQPRPQNDAGGRGGRGGFGGGRGRGGDRGGRGRGGFGGGRGRGGFDRGGRGGRGGGRGGSTNRGGFGDFSGNKVSFD